MNEQIRTLDRNEQAMKSFKAGNKNNRLMMGEERIVKFKIS